MYVCESVCLIHSAVLGSLRSSSIDVPKMYVPVHRVRSPENKRITFRIFCVLRI